MPIHLNYQKVWFYLKRRNCKVRAKNKFDRFADKYNKQEDR